jgi:uncharacterized protein YraI
MRRPHFATGGRRTACAAFACLIVLSGSPFAALAQDAGIASGGETVLLRESPGYDAVALSDVPDGSALDVTGEPTTAADGSTWLPVVVAGQSGYVPAGYIASDVAAPAPADQPVEAAPIAPDSSAQPAESALAAPAEATVGDMVVEPAPAAAASDSYSANPTATTTESNLRAWPGTDAEVLQVLPPGAPLTVNGGAENGFVPVIGNGINGWINADLIGAETDPTLPPPVLASSMTGDNAGIPAPETANVTPALDPATTAPATDPALASIAPPPDVSTGQSTGIVWPFSGGEWEVVQGYNGGTHQNRGGFAQYYYSIDWARSDGNTAGQPIYAPVSGSIQWADRGSGGILIDAGNGYGVALFHVVVNGSVSRGGSVERGQQIGVIAGPGDAGYMSMAHVEIAAWRLLDGGGHESVPFTGPNAIAGQEFPDSGGGNQHMGATVSP